MSIGDDNLSRYYYYQQYYSQQPQAQTIAVSNTSDYTPRVYDRYLSYQQHLNSLPSNWQNLLSGVAQPMADGTKPVVICGGVVTETKDMEEAQRVAEEQAHQRSANAYILKPVRRVAPKREVVSTDL